MPAISLMNFMAQTDDIRRKGVIWKITNESIFLRRLRFVPVDGLAYTYNYQTSLGGIAFRGLNEEYTPDVGAVNPMVERLAILGGEVQTDRQLVNKQGDIARANQVAAKVRRAGLTFDLSVIKGDPAVNPKSFTGLNARLVNRQLIVAGVNGAQLTLQMVDDLIDRVVGLNTQKVLVMNKACNRNLKHLVLAAAHGAGFMDVSKPLDTYDGIPIEVIDEDGDEVPILSYNETTGSSNVTVSIYCIRPGDDAEGEYMQGLIGSNLIEHVQVGLLGTYFKDVIEANIGLALFHGRSAARLSGILAETGDQP